MTLIQTITSIPINCTNFINQTNFQKVQAVSSQPYFTTGFILLFGIAGIIWFFMGFSKVGKKIAFQSWVHWRAALLYMIMLTIAFFWFYYPIIFLWLGG